MSPSPTEMSATARHRLAILGALAHGKEDGRTVAELAHATSLCGRTILAHLRVLEGLKLADRLHYRRWIISFGVNPGSLKAADLEGKKS